MRKISILVLISEGTNPKIEMNLKKNTHTHNPNMFSPLLILKWKFFINRQKTQCLAGAQFYKFLYFVTIFQVLCRKICVTVV